MIKKTIQLIKQDGRDGRIKTQVFVVKYTFLGIPIYVKKMFIDGPYAAQPLTFNLL